MMIRAHACIPGMALLLTAMLWAPLLRAESIELGRWSMKTEFQDQEIAATLTLGFDGTRLTGRWESRGQTMELEEIALSGERLSFVRKMGTRRLEFHGEFEATRLVGEYTGAMGTLPCSGARIESTEPGDPSRKVTPKDDSDSSPDRPRTTASGRPIIDREGKSLLWARERGEDTEYFDVTGSLIPPEEFDHGIGKDRIQSIDEPRFALSTDPAVLQAGITEDTSVLGVFVNGVAKAYPVSAMSRHEIVNDEFGGQPFAVLW